MHDRLFKNQMALERDDVIFTADRIGLNVGTFDRCIESGRPGPIDADEAEGRRLGVMATPAFLLGTMNREGTSVELIRRINGAQPYAAFKHELERALSRQMAELTNGR
jgi:predicted DsbA family dithiol-disulfide isomerase